MTIEFGFTEEQINTQYAPVAALLARYREQNVFGALDEVQIPMRKREFAPIDKLLQVLVSILTSCTTLSETNVRLKSESSLARVWEWSRFVDQSNLSRTLDALTQKQIEQLRHSTTRIWRGHSRIKTHDWRGYLWLDFDLSGLPCSLRAEESQKGFFSDKKTAQDASWLASAPSNTAKRSGQTYSRATGTPAIVCSQPWQAQKLL
ncbi:MAG: hypothetical protein KDI07_12845 [Anaerolineae bacterium]|nr:hypothetical protein [Anaerolineae bacterium]MCB0249457.1 hypothetical protein [Anaerolineae bacterium]